jgi:hypothetical protein
MPNTRVHLAVAFSVCLVATIGPAKGEGGPADECRVVALEALTAQCVREPETSAFYNAGRAFDRSGHRTLAIQQYSSALAHTKRPIELFLAGSLPELAMRHRGVGHRELGDLSQAMADFDALIEADHGNSDARYERARTLLELGRLSDAAADAEIGAWLRPYTADFHHLHAQVLSRMGCHDEAAAVTIQAQKYPPPSELSELSRVLQRVGPITPKQLQELLQDRAVTDWELALRGMAPGVIRQHFMLQKSCQNDDRHALALRIDNGRISVTPSYTGPAGIIAVEEGETLAFTLGAEPCQVRVVVGKGKLPTDAPPTRDDRLSRAVPRNIGSQTIERTIHPSSSAGCAWGVGSIRAYWGSIDHSAWTAQSGAKARSEDPDPRPSKQLLFFSLLGDEPCRITVQVWKGA